MSKRHVLITGATGFLGSRILSRIRGNAGKVSCLSRSCRDGLIEDNVVWHRCDLSETGGDYSGDGLEDVTDVIHAAGQMPNPENRQDSELFYRQNCMATINLSKMISDSVEWFCYVSTADVYRPPEGRALNEDSAIGPETYYASSKYAAEEFLRIFCVQKGIKPAVFRPSQMYGPGDSCSHKFIPASCHSMINDGVIKIYGDGKDMRDYVFVEDAGEIIKFAYMNRNTGVFNIASGRSYSILEVAENIRNAGRADTRIEFEVSKKAKMNWSYDISRIRNELSTVSQTGLYEGISRTLEVLSAGIY